MKIKIVLAALSIGLLTGCTNSDSNKPVIEGLKADIAKLQSQLDALKTEIANTKATASEALAAAQAADAKAARVETTVRRTAASVKEVRTKLDSTPRGDTKTAKDTKKRGTGR